MEDILYQTIKNQLDQHVDGTQWVRSVEVCAHVYLLRDCVV